MARSVAQVKSYRARLCSGEVACSSSEIRCFRLIIYRRKQIKEGLSDFFWPIAACHDQDSINARQAASRRKPTFVKGVHLLSQTIFERLLPPISGRSRLRILTGSKRPKADIQRIRLNKHRGRRTDFQFSWQRTCQENTLGQCGTADKGCNAQYPDWRTPQDHPVTNLRRKLC